LTSAASSGRAQPLRLDERGEQWQGARAFRIEREGDHLTLLMKDNGGDWVAQYRFSLTPHVYADYEEMCLYQQTSPESHFTQGRVCTRLTPDGRVTLSRLRLITTDGGVRHERELAGEQEYEAALSEHFGVVMRG
jgi:N-hydroxyarylamine O-acetyltransferase